MGILAGKRFLITGVLSNRSIAYGVAKACRREGAELAFSYQGDRFKERVAGFAGEFDSKLVFDLDVAEDTQIERAFAQLGETWSAFDGFVHSIGFAPREAISGDFLDGLSRESFRIAHDISSYSFPALAKAALPRLRPGSALLTLTYLGALRSVPNYNTMGLAKASLEASVRYLAASLGGAVSGSTVSRLDRSRHWPRRASRASGRSSRSSRRTHRCAATSRSTMSAMRPPSCCPIWRPA
jgi:enoyl-[acyl-carrier protein] reductase I